ncbi:MAG: MAE_28990/MAE_18760 family HEPN-like nuclease [Xanthobacteraceae bacterium]
MSSEFLDSFNDRKRQVRHYLAIVVAAERKAALGKTTITQERRLLTLRAGTFLLLYNLIEATTRIAIDAIHDRIVTERVPFTLLNLELRKEVLRRFIVGADPTKNHTMADFPIEFVAIALDQGIKLSGNVDAKRIRGLAQCYGFSSDTTQEQTWLGADLLTIKSQRNALAHGFQSYEDIGRDYPARELLAISRRSMAYMAEMLRNISTYLDGSGYREAKPLPEVADYMTDNLIPDSARKSGRDGVPDKPANESEIHALSSRDKFEV